MSAPSSETPRPDDEAQEHPGVAPGEGRVEAEEMDGDSDGGDSRQDGEEGSRPGA